MRHERQWSCVQTYLRHLSRWLPGKVLRSFRHTCPSQCWCHSVQDKKVFTCSQYLRTTSKHTLLRAFLWPIVRETHYINVYASGLCNLWDNSAFWCLLETIETCWNMLKPYSQSWRLAGSSGVVMVAVIPGPWQLMAAECSRGKRTKNTKLIQSSYKEIQAKNQPIFLQVLTRVSTW